MFQHGQNNLVKKGWTFTKSLLLARNFSLLKLWHMTGHDWPFGLVWLASCHLVIVLIFLASIVIFRWPLFLDTFWDTFLGTFFAPIVILRWSLYLLTLDEKKKTNGAATDVPAKSQLRKVTSGGKIGEQIWQNYNSGKTLQYLWKRRQKMFHLLFVQPKLEPNAWIMEQFEQ